VVLCVNYPQVALGLYPRSTKDSRRVWRMEGLYESEICQLLQTVRDHIDEAQDNCAVDNGRDPLEVIESDFTKLNIAIKQLEAEARTQADSSSRKALQSKVKQFKDDAKASRAKFRNLKEREERARLTAGRGAGGMSAEQQDRLLQMNDKMNQSTSALENSKRIMLEIEETAAGVNDQLGQNRASIMSTRRKLEETTTLSGQARQILRRMEHNERVKKLCGYVAIAIVAVAMLCLLYAIIFGF